MSAAQHRPMRRRVIRKSSFGENEAYREILEQSADLREERPEFIAAESAEEQVRMYQDLNEEILREGRA